ncbi:UDP-glycosyltransferase 74E1 [Glycine soja]
MVHCVILPYPSQGHINPMHQFSKLLQLQGVRITLVTTLSYSKNLQNIPASIALETISDGFDNGGLAEAGSYKTYLERFWQVGAKTLAELLEKLGRSGKLRVPLTKNEISLPLLPKLQLEDMPSFLSSTDGENLVLLDLAVAQFSNVDKADWILCNSFYELEKEEIAYSLRDGENYFLWVVRASEETKLPKDFEKISEKGLVIRWCSQLKVLDHEAIGCFVTHCGWNSTLEALSLGVPVVAMPYWSDQSTNAKQIVDVWKMGIRATVDDEKKIVRREVLKRCIMEIMKSERGKEVKSNMVQWKALAARAVSEEGSSHKNIAEFVNSLFNLQQRIANYPD